MKRNRGSKFIGLLLVTMLLTAMLCATAQAAGYGSASWTNNDKPATYGSVQNIDGNAYWIKPGTVKNGGGYGAGPFVRDNQKLANGTLVQEIHVYINIEDEASTLDNGVKFILSSALNNDAGNYTAEYSYLVQKSGNRVMVGNIPLTKSGIYTFRIETTSDTNGCYSELIIKDHDKVVGRTGKQKLNETAGAPVGLRYLWVSSLNVTNGIKVYTTLPVANTALPKTGDSTPLMLLVVMMGLSAAGLMVSRKKCEG